MYLFFCAFEEMIPILTIVPLGKNGSDDKQVAEGTPCRRGIDLL